jgi:ribosomal protein S18 acetylase RimI-like enzyme
MATKENDIQVRQMKETDIKAILEIDRAISSVERAFTYDDLVNGLIGGEIASSFVAEVGSQVVGFVMATIAYVPEQVTEVCMIQIIGVHPNHRHRGVASKLVGALADACSSKDIKMIRVMVDRHDRQLQGFFETLEFRPGNLIDYSLPLP